MSPCATSGKSCGTIVDNTLSKLLQLPICTPHPISKWNFIQGALGVPLALVQWRLGAPIIPALGINRIQTECHGEMRPGQTSNASQSCSYLSGCEDHGIFRQWQLKKKSTWLIKWEDRDVLSRVGFLGFNLGDLMQLSDLSGWRIELIEPWQRSLWRLFFLRHEHLDHFAFHCFKFTLNLWTLDPVRPKPQPFFGRAPVLGKGVGRQLLDCSWECLTLKSVGPSNWLIKLHQEHHRAGRKRLSG